MSDFTWNYATVTQIESATATLQDLAELFKDEERWTQGDFGATFDGRSCPVRVADCFCLVGGLTRVGAVETIYHARTALADANKVDSIVDWNDAEGRRIEEVREFLRNGIVFLEEQKVKKFASAGT